jgi:hypothetical protein
VDLTLTPEERAADTQRTVRRDELPPPALDPLTESTAQLLRRELALTRESLPTLPGASVPVASLSAGPPPSLRTRSRKALIAAVGVSAAAVLSSGLTVLGGIATKRWPAYADLIQAIVRFFGGGP